MPEFFSRGELFHRRWAYEGAARGATRVVTASEHSRDRLVQAAGVDPDRIDVVPLGIDHERFRPGPVEGDAAVLEPLALPERFLVYPANLWPHKNHERLLEALGECADREISLVLTGQEYGRGARLMETAARVGVAGRVRHLGYVERAAVPALYRGGDGHGLPEPLRGLRLARDRGDGVRLPGGRVAERLARRGGR